MRSDAANFCLKSLVGARVRRGVSPRGLEQRPVKGLSRKSFPCRLGLASCHVSPVGFPGTCPQVGRCSLVPLVGGFNAWMGVRMTAKVHMEGRLMR